MEQAGHRSVARLSGPLLQNGRFEDDGGRAASDAGGLENEPDGDSPASPESSEGESNSTSANSYSWSETSLVLEGNCLEDSRQQLITLYRSQILREEEDITARSLGGRVGAVRRALGQATWYDVQRIARQRLQGDSLRQWQQYEFEATHEHRRKRVRRA